MIKPKCVFCGTNGGTVTNGGHNICLARAKRGSPIIPVGNHCQKCNGTGYARIGVCAEINPPSTVFEKLVTFCPHCIGGVVRGC